MSEVELEVVPLSLSSLERLEPVVKEAEEPVVAALPFRDLRSSERPWNRLLEGDGQYVTMV